MTILIKTPQAGFTCPEDSVPEFFAEKTGSVLGFYSAERPIINDLCLIFKCVPADYWDKKHLVID
jgi:hypothetical protein